ncbi:MAG: 50S ribosomal protein L22 [Candidatus Gracilibacteria bacterium]|nr:50S ribosomal protein L22 [Candidatus Gracilibacteria bacterium]
MKSNCKYIRISPRKANLIADLVRGKNVEEAISLLKFLPKKAADILYKIVLSAVANAENNLKLDRKTLYIKTIVVNKAPTLKRGQPVSRGRWHPIKKRNSHITVELATR